MLQIFADLNADFNPGSLSDLAGQGTHGVEVLAIAATAAVTCGILIFIYRFYTDARKYDVIRDDALRGITTAVQEYTAAAQKIFDKTDDSLERIEDKLVDGVEDIKAKADANRKLIDDHEKRISTAEVNIREHDDAIKTLTAAPVKAAAAAKPRKKKK